MGRIEEMTRLTQLKFKLIDDINNLSSDSYIDLEFKNIKDYYTIQNFIKNSSDCFNKEIGLMYDRETGVARILPHKLRKHRVTKEIETKKRERCIRRLLSEKL